MVQKKIKSDSVTTNDNIILIIFINLSSLIIYNEKRCTKSQSCQNHTELHKVTLQFIWLIYFYQEILIKKEATVGIW